MKILRILSMAVSLNVPFAHANGTVDYMTQILVNRAKQMVVAVGILYIADGLVEIADGASLLPSFAVSKKAGINGACKAGLGAVLFVAAQPNQ